MPFAPAASSNGASAGTPGLGMIKSCRRNASCVWPPSSKITPAERSFAAASATSDSARASVAVTMAPRAAQNNAVATPVRASPTTSTRLFFSSIDPGIALRRSTQLPQDSLSQFQRRQRKQRENQRRNPKAHDHLRFAPTRQFEMMMDRRHAKNPLPTQFEGTNLQDHGNRFDDKNPANKKQQDFLFDDDGDGAERAPKRERADIAHEDFGRMR